MAISVAVLISGGGTTLENLLTHIGDGRLDARIACVVSSRPGVRGLDIAEQARIPAAVVARKSHQGVESFSDAITAVLDQHRPDLVLLGGFLSLYHIPPHYMGKVLNIHNALIPAFCGQGYYGMRVHREVVESGVKISGCTVHFADNVYDHGPIILQRVVPVTTEDTPEEVQKRVFVEECEAYPEAVQLFADGRLEMDGNRVRVLPAPR